MKASDIMTKGVVTVDADTSVKDIAALMTKHRISGVPVVDANNRLLGILSESDLLHRPETGTERRRKWWLSMLVDSDSLARDYAKAHGLKARDVMSSAVVTVAADAELRAVADVLDRRRLKRVPVVSDSKLVGIITRGDLVRALADAQRGPQGGTVDDQALSKSIAERMRRETWLNAGLVNVQVKDGAVELFGVVPSADQRRALRILVEETPGVTKVEDLLRVGPVSMTA